MKGNVTKILKLVWTLTDTNLSGRQTINGERRATTSVVCILGLIHATVVLS